MRKILLKFKLVAKQSLVLIFLILWNTSFSNERIDIDAFIENANKTSALGIQKSFGINNFLNKLQIDDVHKALLNSDSKDSNIFDLSFYYDYDEDGDPDELIFFEKGTNRGGYIMLVKVIDNDDDMKKQGEGDRDNDTWLIDYAVDGRIDRVNDYGFDSENKLFYQYVYYSGFAHAFPGGILTYSKNKLIKFLHLTDYEYFQPIDQWKSDFSQDMELSMFYFDTKRNKMFPMTENPFTFYDVNHNGFSDIALRVSTDANKIKNGNALHSVRLSFNIDADADENSPYDYDFSLTSIGSVPVDLFHTRKISLRAVETEKIYDSSKGYGNILKAKWDAVQLVWDEDDYNYSDNIELSDNSENSLQRWEGVINFKYKDFPQVGGPSVRYLNKRVENKMNKDDKVELYWSSFDNRLHLYGAKEGQIKIDFNDDKVTDLTVNMNDSNSDGVFDQWFFITPNGESNKIQLKKDQNINLFKISDIITNKFSKLKFTKKYELEELSLLGKINVPINYISLILNSMKEPRFRPYVDINTWRKSFFSTYASLHVILQVIDKLKVCDSSENANRLLTLISEGDINQAVTTTLNLLNSNDRCNVEFSK